MIHAAVRDVEVVDISRTFVFGDGKDINVMQHGADDLAARTVGFDKLVFLLHALRFLETHLRSQSLHLTHQGRTDFPCVSLEDFFHLGDVFHILLMRLLSGTRALAVLDVVLQAHLKLAGLYVFRRQSKVAGAYRVEALDKLQNGIHRRYMAIRAEIGRTVADNLSGAKDTRKVFIRHTDGRIGLVVLQQDVVTRLVFLDKVVFEQQGVFLRIDHRVGYVVNLAYKHFRLETVYLLVKIGRHTVLEVLRLAYVYYRAALVVILVAAGLVGHIAYDGLQALEPFLVFFFSHDV